MSTAYAETAVVDFIKPAESSQIEQYRNLSAVRWGMSPAFDIDIRDRIVLPEGVTTIPRMTLVPFRNREYKVLRSDDKSGASAVPMFERAAGVSEGLGFPSAGDVNMEVHEKTAYACAEEIRHAYANNNPWGFTVFNALTGIEKREVVNGLLRAVLPKQMSIPEVVEYLQTVSPINIAETPWPEGELTRVNGKSLTCADVAESMRVQLLEGILQSQTFAEITLEESDEEIHQKAGGGKGKARADNRDKMLAEALNRPVPVARPQVVAPVAPTINPAIESALALLLKREEAREQNGDRVAELEAKLEAQAEETRSLTATVRDLLAAKESKGKGK